MVPRSGSRLDVCCLLLTAILLTLSVSIAAAQAGKVEAIGPLNVSGVSDSVKQAIADKGLRVTLDDGWSADFWFARSLATASNSATGALYPQLGNGEFVGVETFPKGTSDFRGQSIAAGTYTLRYQYIPQDANHMGVSRNPDFLLAIPIASDTNPADNLALKRLVALSSKASGTAHPAVFALAPAGSPATVTKDDQGMLVFTAETASPSGKAEKIGIVVKGQATQ